MTAEAVLFGLTGEPAPTTCLVSLLCVTQARAASWLVDSGLELDKGGFIRMTPEMLVRFDEALDLVDRPALRSCKAGH